MKFLFHLIVALIVGLKTSVQTYTIEDYQKYILAVSNNVAYNDDFQNNVQKLLKQEPNYFNYTPFKKPGYTFDCDTSEFVSAQVPTSVHKLRPGDINVVAAMGDSITAAAGGNARTILGLLTEYRDRSWSIGGKQELEQIVTLPNILKKFNPHLKGASTKSDFILLAKEGDLFKYREKKV